MRLVAEELSRAGFEHLRTMNWPTSGTIRHYCMLFRKPKALKSTPIIWHGNAPAPRFAAPTVVHPARRSLPQTVVSVLRVTYHSDVGDGQDHEDQRLHHANY